MAPTSSGRESQNSFTKRWGDPLFVAVARARETGGVSVHLLYYRNLPMATIFRRPPQTKMTRTSESHGHVRTADRVLRGTPVEKALPNFHLTKRDIAIVEAVYAHRALTTQHIETLLFRPSTHSRCLLRVRLLHQHGYLLRSGQPQELSEGRRHYVYWLAQKGAELVAINQGREVPELDWRLGEHKVKTDFLEHLLDTNTFRIAVTLALHKLGYALEAWRDDRTLKREHAKESVTIHGPQGGSEQVAFVPDGYFSYAAGDYTYRQFLETDRRTVTGSSEVEKRPDWARKVNAYLAYYNSEKIHERYGSRKGRVLTVTTGEKRVANLKAITEREGGKGKFWFTTLDQVTPETVLTAPIWRKAGSDELHSLIW